MARRSKDRRQSPSAGSGTLSVGDIVRSTINPELKGRIVSCDVSKAKIELLTYPTPWWQKWGKRPVPVLVKNLKLVEAASEN